MITKLIQSGGLMTVPFAEVASSQADDTDLNVTIPDPDPEKPGSEEEEYSSSITESGGTLGEVPVVVDSSVDVDWDMPMYSTTISSGGTVNVTSGGTTSSTTVTSGGLLNVGGSSSTDSGGGGSSDGGTQIPPGGVDYDYYYEEVLGSDHLDRDATATDTTIENYGGVVVSSGGTLKDTVITSGGNLSVESGGNIGGQLDNASGANVVLDEGAVVDFTVAEQQDRNTALISDWGNIEGRNSADYTLTVDTKQASGRYVLASNANGFNESISVKNTLGMNFCELTLGQKKVYRSFTFRLAVENSELVLTIEHDYNSTPKDLEGSQSALQWDADDILDNYTVEYSTDNFEHVFSISVDTLQLSSFGLPTDTYSWRVKAEDNEGWVTGENIVSDNAAADTSQLLKSDEDGNTDVFFANSIGKWSVAHSAQHTGSKDGSGWTGTNETVALAGKNRFGDIFEASSDANILLLTDDADGDALFVDDIFTESYNDLAQQQSRLAQLDEIRAGAGDDLVDMTSQRFVYTGDGLVIRGGDGNDVIWANKGNNRLFGDAGDDRIVGASGNDIIVGGAGDDSMHGGGGNDFFCFGGNWGDDIIEQLEGGTVTLCFEEEVDLTFTAQGNDTLVTCGDNTILVKNMTLTEDNCRFGDAGLASLGAFADATSYQIFESKDKPGILA